jgi:hypothetical protein
VTALPDTVALTSDNDGQLFSTSAALYPQPPDDVEPWAWEIWIKYDPAAAAVPTMTTKAITMNFFPILFFYM